MKTYFILCCILLLSCNKKQPVTTLNEESQPKKELLIQDMNFKDIMKLDKNQAIKKYGKPNKISKDLLDNMQGEFYNNIQDAFNEVAVSSNLITIEELTWTKDSLHNITVWYQKKGNNTATSKAYLIWEKGSEF